jgi:large subunit ribosomal protein L24
MKVKKGDTVKVLYGKDSGKTGKVLRVIAKLNTVVVDGVNMYKKHIKGDGQKRNSEIVEIVKPMNVAKLMVVCPECGKATRVKSSVIDGKSMRACVKCSKSIDVVKVEKKSTKVEKPKDTKKVVKKVKSESKE